MRKSVKGIVFGSLMGLCLGFTMVAIESCDRSDREKHVLSHPEMVKVLMEVYLTEQKVNRFGLTQDSSLKEFERFKKKVFTQNNISDSLFKESFDYYMDRPREMEMIYSALVDSLSLMEQRFESTIKSIK